jgi:hypothetical protein
MIAVGLTLDLAAYAGTIAAILGLTLLMLSLANLLMLFVRDSFAAVLISFAVFMAVFIPSIVYLYRPDTYLTSPISADVAVFPLTLQWHPDVAAVWGYLIGLGFAAVAAGLVLAAGAILSRRDIT